MIFEKSDLTRIDLDRVKRNAKCLSKTHNISLCKAQNEIACSFGFQTFESLRVAVLAARVPSSPTLTVSDDPDLENILAWFKSRFTNISKYEARVSPLIAKSLRQYVLRHGSSVLRPVDVADEIDYGYDFNQFRLGRHPKALAAEILLEAEGQWVANTFLDGFSIRKGGFGGDGSDDVVGHNLAFNLFDELGGAEQSA